jgi:hypothetical protein
MPNARTAVPTAEHWTPKVEAGKSTIWAGPSTTEEKLAQGWQYVSIPKEDPINSKQDHPAIRINRRAFAPGQTYLLPPQMAETVRQRLAAFHVRQMRVLKPDVDTSALEVSSSDSAKSTKNFSPEAEVFAVS